jgi:hypothetical protein
MTGPHRHVEQAGTLSETEFRALYQRLRRRADWGPADRRGALNYITPAEILTAVGGVRLGQTVTLAAPVATGVTADNPEPGQHQMTRTAINALGLHLLDYLQFDDLLPFCEREGRWSFLCVVAPVRLRAGTGSLINPIAIL